MGLKSCLYEMSIMHERRQPFVRRFEHKMFMFYLDLDEINTITQKLWFLGHNQNRVYNYREADHIGDIKVFLKSKGIEEQTKYIRLLTNVRTFGYVFNPVSFYFCFDAEEKPLAVVVEIGNTFGELKYYFLKQEHLKVRAFKDQQTKYFYISPFTDLNNTLDFDIQVPDEVLKIGIDVFKGQERFFFSSMNGVRKELNNTQLLLETLKFPLVTLRVIFLIHWHAMVLHLKYHLPFHRKEENIDMQQGVGRKKEKHNANMV